MKDNFSKSGEQGDYYSAFFYMKFPELYDSAEKYLESSAFAHEFVHYLQDLNLPYCIRETLGKMDKFQNVQDYSKEHGGTIPIPFRQWNANASLLNEQFERTSGEGFRDGTVSGKRSNTITAKPSAKAIHREVDSAAYGYRSFDVYDYTVPVANGGDYSVGADDFLEYIAYKIQMKHYPDSECRDILPYNTIDQLFENHGLSNVPEEVKLNIVEACLYNDHPMRLFEHFYFQSDDFQKVMQNPSYNSIYKMNLNLIFQTTDGKTEQLKGKRERRWNQFRLYMRQDYSKFPKLVTWIEGVNQFAKAKWKNRFLFSDLYQADTKHFRKEIRRIIKDVGLPLIVSYDDSEFQTLGGHGITKEDFLPFYLCQNFMERLLDHDDTNERDAVIYKCPIECPMENLCCSTESSWFPEWGRLPCRRYKEPDADCPYVQFINAFGFKRLDSEV